jgi:hypothetical protein
MFIVASLDSNSKEKKTGRDMEKLYLEKKKTNIQWFEMGLV